MGAAVRTKDGVALPDPASRTRSSASPHWELAECSVNPHHRRPALHQEDPSTGLFVASGLAKVVVIEDHKEMVP